MSDNPVNPKPNWRVHAADGTGRAPLRCTDPRRKIVPVSRDAQWPMSSTWRCITWRAPRRAPRHVEARLRSIAMIERRRQMTAEMRRIRSEMRELARH